MRLNVLISGFFSETLIVQGFPACYFLTNLAQKVINIKPL